MRPVDALLGEEAPGALGRVARRVDREGEHRHVVAELVQRAADLLGGQRAGVLARRVEERHHDGLAAVLAQRRDLAVLVAQPEVARAGCPAGGSSPRTAPARGARRRR